MLPSYLSQEALRTFLEQALEEDLGARGDVTTMATVAPETRVEATLTAKESGTVAGLTVCSYAFELVDPSVQVSWELGEGARVAAGQLVGRLRGRAPSLLAAERLALNLLQRMSGIATATRAMVDRVAPYEAHVLDTRKTAPNMRALDKWAVQLGGGRNHRMGLFDMILIKDNHIAACGGIGAAIEAAHRFVRASDEKLLIEVEVRTLGELEDVLAAQPVDRVLLDNMARPQEDGSVDVSLLETAVARIDGRMATEASGNITLETAEAIAATGVDALSCGSLTHSVKALDLSMRVERWT